MQRATPSEVSKVKPIGAVSWNSCRPSSALPGGALGCTRTGRPLVDLLPDSLERRIGKSLTTNVRKNHHTYGTLIQRSREFLNCKFGVLPGQGGEPADAVGPGLLRLRHLVVHDARRLEADLGRAPEG